jgi:hypothetical protein
LRQPLNSSKFEFKNSLNYFVFFKKGNHFLNQKTWYSGVTSAIVANAAQCHLRPERLGHKRAGTCELCRINASFKAYSDQFNVKANQNIQNLNVQRMQRLNQRNEDNEFDLLPKENNSRPGAFLAEDLSAYGEMPNPSDLEKTLKHINWFVKYDQSFKKKIRSY